MIQCSDNNTQDKAQSLPDIVNKSVGEPPVL